MRSIWRESLPPNVDVPGAKSAFGRRGTWWGQEAAPESVLPPTNGDEPPTDGEEMPAPPGDGTGGGTGGGDVVIDPIQLPVEPDKPDKGPLGFGIIPKLRGRFKGIYPRSQAYKGHPGGTPDEFGAVD